MAQAEVLVSEISKQYEISTLYTVNLKNNMNKKLLESNKDFILGEVHCSEKTNVSNVLSIGGVLVKIIGNLPSDKYKTI